MEFYDTEMSVINWANDRNLIQGSSPQAQMLKLTEEMGELAGGIAKGNMSVIKDSIGDVLVVLTLLSAQLKIDLDECYELAYQEIKDRKGCMVDGVFVKDE